MVTTGRATALIKSCIDFVTVRRRQLCAFASVVLFVVSLSRYWVRFDPSESLRRGFGEPTALAHALNDEGTFANPFAVLDTGPSAHLSPVFPTFMALLMKVFGAGSAGAYALKWAAILTVSLQLALYPLFSRILGMGEINGIIAASIWIVAKPRLSGDWEALYAATLVAVACCCYRLYLARQLQRRPKMAWLLGCLMGFLIFTLPTMAPVYATWLAWEIWRQGSAFLRRSLVPLVLLPILVIAPWTIRNFLVFHRFIFIRDNFGLELSVSNNDCAQFGIQANLASGCFDKLHPNHNVNEARKVMEMGEVKYNDLRLREALHWIGSHSVRFTELCLMRFTAFWMPTETFTIHYTSGRRLERVLIYLMTLLSVGGLVILYQRDVTSAAIVLSCLTVFPLIYYVVQFQDRYRYPIMWMTFLLGALPITTCAQRLWEGGTHRRVVRPMARNAEND
jgi:hypothetical protein